MVLIALFAILPSYFAGHVAAQITPLNALPFFSTATLGGGIGTATAFIGTATGFGGIFGTDTALGPSPTGPFNSGINAANNSTKNMGKVVGITVVSRIGHGDVFAAQIFCVVGNYPRLLPHPALDHLMGIHNAAEEQEGMVWSYGRILSQWRSYG